MLEYFIHSNKPNQEYCKMLVTLLRFLKIMCVKQNSVTVVYSKYKHSFMFWVDSFCI